MSQCAIKAIGDSDCLIGYSTYIKLLGSLTLGKEVIPYGMTQEVERAHEAIKKALQGESVCVISSGDPGVYGMAGVILELLGSRDAKYLDLEIIPGIISATACASLLGAPLMHDFAAISLSDLLTDTEEIEKRLTAAAQSGFIIVLYNPKSRHRTKLLARAWKIIRKYRAPQTPVGIVKNAYREREAVKIVRLRDATLSKDIDMSTTIIVGNHRTYIKNGYMITPRGYNLKKGYK